MLRLWVDGSNPGRERQERGGNVNIRLRGTYDEVIQAQNIALKAFTVIEVSGPYANRPPSAQYRLFLEVRLPPKGDGEPAHSPTPALPPPRKARRS
jgi:hypothetical protein